MKLLRIISLAVIGFAVAVGLRAVETPTPDVVVREYIEAFRKKDKAKMFSCLSDTFFDEFKSEYTVKIEAYPAGQKKALLRIFGADSISEITAMSGRTILSTFLDMPAAESYWKSFDSFALAIEVETLKIFEGRALVRSFMSVKENPTVKVETAYALLETDKGWQIERFRKRVIRPNQAPATR